MTIQSRNNQKQNYAMYIKSNVYFEEILVLNKYILFISYKNKMIWNCNQTNVYCKWMKHFRWNVCWNILHTLMTWSNMAGIHFYSYRAKENIGLNFQFRRRRYFLFVLNNEIHASSFYSTTLKKFYRQFVFSQEKYINDFSIFTFPIKRFHSPFSRMIVFEV